MANANVTSPTSGAGDVSPTGNLPGSSTNSKMRKRTKTGCLTCRKRRIKCGEERPTCANCIKSKRQCEGYNQRVIFKTPIENWPNHPGHVSTIQYHTSMLPGTRNQPYRPSQSSAQPQESSLTSIQPRPLSNFEFPTLDTSSDATLAPTQHVIVGAPPSYPQDASYQQPLPSPHHQQPLVSPHHHTPLTTTMAPYFPQPSPIHTNPPAHYSQEPSISYQSSPQYDQGQAAYQHIPVSYDSQSEPRSVQALYQPPPASQPEEQNSYHSHSSVSPRSDHYTPYTEPRPALQRYNSHPQGALQHVQVSSADMSRPYNYPVAISHADFSHSSYSSAQIPFHDLASDVKYMPQLGQPPMVSKAQQIQSETIPNELGGVDHVSPTQVLYEAAIENEDDDYWDVHSDEEMLDVEVENHNSIILGGREFNILRRIHHEQSNELTVRRHDAFIYDGLLTHYKPEYAASPLRNLTTARVFAHYIHVTAPSISIYERNPRNSMLIFEDTIPAERQALWTYTLPLRALSNQGLLHAMLALASLQIARIQNASPTPSFKHYAYSLKRLSRDLGNQQKRLSIPTLATSLLLAYYEVWTADPVKWSTHLVGAAQLLTELDFRSLTREARRLKAARTAEERQFPYQNPEMLIDKQHFNKRLEERAMMPDESLVSIIIGKKVNYDDFGMIVEENGARYEKRTNMSDKLDLQSYETYQDLYWWYTRHDAFQSMVSGNPLIFPYRKWSDCPPRSPLGRADALYGSYDHMMLLIGRISDFNCRDRPRKLRQVEADGGWRPRPGMPGFGSTGPPRSTTTNTGPPDTTGVPTVSPSQMQAPPLGGFEHGQEGPSAGIRKGSSSSHNRPPSAMPEFFGMAPAGPPAPLPNSYANPNYERSPVTPNAPHPKYSDLPAAYLSALEEWEIIDAAHTTVSHFLANTESFMCLPADISPPVPGGTENMTPFGPAMIHRSYNISNIWTMLHLAKILLLRSHPTMPPAAHMAAGVCAPATQPYAMLIGRITAGMQIPVGKDLPPSLGGVLTESTLSLFFAGVQYQDPKQREWLITRLLEIDKRTGWASALMIAQGCETAWEKAAMMGRGPPYQRRTRSATDKGPVKGHTGWRTMSDGRDGTTGNIRNEEQGFVFRKHAPSWAMNLLGTEEELRAGMERVGL